MGESLGDDFGTDACGIAGSDENVGPRHGSDRIKDRRCCEGIDFFQSRDRVGVRCYGV
jgi:hypothetical protein